MLKVPIVICLRILFPLKQCSCLSIGYVQDCVNSGLVISILDVGYFTAVACWVDRSNSCSSLLITPCVMMPWSLHIWYNTKAFCPLAQTQHLSSSCSNLSTAICAHLAKMFNKLPQGLQLSSSSSCSSLQMLQQAIPVVWRTDLLCRPTHFFFNII